MERSGLQSDWIRNRARLTGVRAIASIVALAAAALIFAPSEGEAASRGEADGGSRLGMASKRFPDLSRAERALLEHSDVRNPDRPAFAQCETSSNPDDPSNDPRYAVERPHEGDTRASLIAWRSEDAAAAPLINRAGIKALGARIVGGLDLSYVRVPFALTIRRCSIAERIVLTGDGNTASRSQRKLRQRDRRQRGHRSR